jgi:hypothetical protein
MPSLDHAFSTEQGRALGLLKVAQVRGPHEQGLTPVSLPHLHTFKLEDVSEAIRRDCLLSLSMPALRRASISFTTELEDHDVTLLTNAFKRCPAIEVVELQLRHGLIPEHMKALKSMATTRDCDLRLDIALLSVEAADFTRLLTSAQHTTRLTLDSTVLEALYEDSPTRISHQKIDFTHLVELSIRSGMRAILTAAQNRLADDLFWHYTSCFLLYNDFPQLARLSIAAYRTSPAAVMNMATLLYSPSLAALQTLQAHLRIEERSGVGERAHVKRCNQ